MSRQLDQIVADAASKNLGFAQALETLTTLELEARNTRAIERRFRTSRLHARYSIDSFRFKHHKSRMEAKNRIVRLLDLDFLQKGTSIVLIGNPGVGKTFLAKVIRLARVSSQPACSVHHCHGHAQSLECIAGRSLAGPQTPGLR